jgi:hypothetical protein
MKGITGQPGYSHGCVITRQPGYAVFQLPTSVVGEHIASSIRPMGWNAKLGTCQRGGCKHISTFSMCLVALKGPTYGGMFPNLYMHVNTHNCVLTCVLYSISGTAQARSLAFPPSIVRTITFLAPVGDPLVPRLLVVRPILPQALCGRLGPPWCIHQGATIGLWGNPSVPHRSTPE